MLVLSRYVDEEIVIGESGPEQIRVMVVAIQGNQVRLGIDAPRNVPVHRLEVAERRPREHE